jgi:uncharacterized protein
VADDSKIRQRIEKDIRMFYDNLGKIASIKDEPMLKTVELSKMYASDAKSYLEKGDFYTAFSCVSYAHGLLDAVLKLNNMK